ncbi:phosphotransferase family protein [Phaeobacter sp. HF9A]|uniref:phosphotransferase family protein n=1 Tax=Phaeobacter sp. HF9A TaxID=2721561 RepID=UPI00143076C9|nr:phosphotransferase [Phaeobacter sp. HF9A]NIZ13284.1 phosphotransferase [Phaeobacter sp. HF9A]
MSGGRSNHVWRAGDMVVKFYRQGQNNPLFANDPVRERRVLQGLSGTGMAPRYLGHGHWDGRAWLIYSHMNGMPWQQDTAHVARLLGILHDQAGIDGLPEGINGSLALERQTQEILARCDTGAEMIRRLQPQGRVPALRTPCLIHGDPVPGNLLSHDGTLALIDWQCPQQGDPAEDLALFLSPAMQLLYRGEPLSVAEESAFARAYPDRRVVARYYALRPWFHWRMAAYCHWRGDLVARDLELAALQSIRPRTA